MKKILSMILAVGLILLCASCSKKIDSDVTSIPTENNSDIVSQTEETNQETLSDKLVTSDENTGIGGDFIWCCHRFEYHNIEGNVRDFIESKSPGAFDKFGDMFSPTEDFNVRFCFDYFGIPKEMWWDIYDKDFISKHYKDYEMFKFDEDLWFSDTYYMEDIFLVEPGVCPEANSVYIRPEDDDIHTDRYFTIHPSLINYVGEDKFEEFKNKYAGTEDFNILNFIKYFNISKETFSKLTETKAPGTGKIYYIYNTEFVYGTEEMQKQYFEKQPLDLK